ncbi:reverse transcriptase domain-containing protein [Tanacetum coccineum]
MKRPLTPDQREALKDKGFKWLREGVIRRVQYPRWVANVVPIRQKDNAWWMHVDYTSLNKVCAKDMYPLPKIEGELGSLMGYQYKCFLPLPREHNQVPTLQRMINKVLEDQKGQNVKVYLEEIVVKSRTEEILIEDIEETLDKLRMVNVKIDPNKCTFRMEEGNFLGYVVTTEGIKVDPEKSAEVAETFDWTSEATEAFQKIRGRLAKLPTLTVPKEGEILMSATAWDRNLLHSDRKGGTDIGSHGKVLKDNLSEAPSQDIQRKEAEGQVVKKFFGQGEQTLYATEKNRGEISGSREMPQEEQVPMPRSWRLYIGRETGKEGSRVRMIIDSAEGKVYLYAIRLNFHASEDSMDYEALLVGLVASAGRGMKDLHIFIDSKMLVDQIEENRTPRTKETKRYREDIMDATTLFHTFWITHLPKSLNPKAKALKGLASIKLELLNQEVSVGIKTRPTMETARKDPEETRNEEKEATEKLKSTWEENNGSN